MIYIKEIKVINAKGRLDKVIVQLMTNIKMLQNELNKVIKEKIKLMVSDYDG